MNLRATLRCSIAGATWLAVAAVGFPNPGYATSSIGPAMNASAAVTPPMSSGSQDVLKLAGAKVSDEVILAFIRNSDRRYDLTAAEIIRLREAGVTDRVLAAMITHQPAPSADGQPAPTATASASTPIAAAPQYLEAPADTSGAESLASTVYVVPGNTTYATYYSDPWPYYSYSYWWYASWPYYWSWWYYPYYSCGWYWNNGHDHDGHWDHHDHDNDWSHNGHSTDRSGTGRDAAAGRVPPTRPANGSPVGQAAPLANGNRPSAVQDNQTASAGTGRSDSTRSARAIPNGRDSGAGQFATSGEMSASARQANREVASRQAGDFTPASSTTGVNSSRPTRTWIDGSTARATATRPLASPNGVQSVTRPSAPATSIWSANGQPTVSSRSGTNPRTVAAAPTSRPASAPTTTWTRIGSQPASRYRAGPTVNYQRSGGSSAYSARPSMPASSYSRPAMSAPSRGGGSPSAFRSSGGFSSGAAARPSLGGGSFRGGGGRR